jgi:hypothetical protein
LVSKQRSSLGGHVELLQWIKESPYFPIPNGNLVLHAAFSNQVETARYLIISIGCCVTKSNLQIASLRLNSEVFELLRICPQSQFRTDLSPVPLDVLGKESNAFYRVRLQVNILLPLLEPSLSVGPMWNS